MRTVIGENVGCKTTCLVAAVLALTAFMSPFGARAADEPAKIKIVASLFPQYDFARLIGGEKVDVRLLLPPGAESHSYEPTPGDMRDITSADLFIYTGPHMEPWAKRLADAASTPGGVLAVDASEGVEHSDGDASNGNPDAVHEHGESEPAGDGHFHQVDPHIWLDPSMAATMVETIALALEKRDGANAGYYRDNAINLRRKLDELDAGFRKTVAESPRRLLVFGERFAFAYFFDRYGLEMAGAYKNCAPGAEPGLRAVIEVVETVRKEKVKYIYLEDTSTGRISDLIHKETGVEILRVDSLHNPPRARQEAGEGYVEIMRTNMDAFAKGLQ